MTASRGTMCRGLTQQIYQSSYEWDYDFQNMPELGATDFWSDFGGMGLHWIRPRWAAGVPMSRPCSAVSSRRPAITS